MAAPLPTVSLPPEEAIQAEAEQAEVLENEFIALSFTNRGARLTSARLKKYLDYDGRPLEMVSSFGPDRFLLDTVFERNPELQDEASRALFRVGSGASGLTFSYASQGLKIVREIRLERAFRALAMKGIDRLENALPRQG